MHSAPLKRTLTPAQQARRTRILEASRKLLAEQGYDGMIMRDVAQLAEVSPTTLYNLYNTKDELLLAALRESVAESWRRAAELEPDPGFERLLAQMRMSAVQTRENPAFAKAIVRALFKANADDAILEFLIERNQRAVATSLRAMSERNELQPTCDLDALARSMVANFWSIYFLWASNLIDAHQLERELQRGYLALLQGAAQGDLHGLIAAQLEPLYRAAGYHLVEG